MLATSPSHGGLHLQCVAPAELDAIDRQECCQLWANCFPKSDRTWETVSVERAAESAMLIEEKWHIIWTDKNRSGASASRQAIAAARSFNRTITVAGAKMVVRGMAHVCSDPDRRGQGLGGMIVRAVFDSSNISEGRGGENPLPIIFQTDYALFYEKFGAATIPRSRNPIVNSTGEGSDSKRQGGFWDKFAMIYPASTAASFPEGTIDLLGPGF